MESPYKEMYLALFSEMTETIERLTKIQQQAEELYLNFEEHTVPQPPEI